TLGMGALLAVAMSSSTEQAITVERLKKLGSGFALWAFVVLVALYAFKPGTSLQFIFLDITTATVFTWIVAVAANGSGGIVGKTLQFPPFVYIGKISYGIYLYHIFVSGLAEWISHRLGLVLPTSALIQFIIFAPISIALASVSWFVFERPVTRLRRRLSYRPETVEENDWRITRSSEVAA
ncbi:MAG TPA: hypothetical protein VM099_01590, partial [Gemmatimonadaceae bacterium]|nr:hypothetical protein [Gemmatimonadaceae bacterium]